MVVYLFIGVVAALVDIGLDGIILMVDTELVVVTSSFSPPISFTSGILEDLDLPLIVLSLVMVTC